MIDIKLIITRTNGPIFSAKDVQKVFNLSARQAYYVIRISLLNGSIVPAKIELQTYKLFAKDMRVKYYCLKQ